MSVTDLSPFPRAMLLLLTRVQGPLPKMLDLTAEESSMALILIECLYLGSYTDYTEESHRNFTTAQRLWLQEYYNEKIARLGGKYSFPALQAFAQNRVLQCRWLAEQERQRHI